MWSIILDDPVEVLVLAYLEASDTLDQWFWSTRFDNECIPISGIIRHPLGYPNVIIPAPKAVVSQHLFEPWHSSFGEARSHSVPDLEGALLKLPSYNPNPPFFPFWWFSHDSPGHFNNDASAARCVSPRTALWAGLSAHLRCGISHMSRRYGSVYIYIYIIYIYIIYIYIILYIYILYYNIYIVICNLRFGFCKCLYFWGLL